MKLLISYLLNLTYEQKFELIKSFVPSIMTGLSVIIGALLTVYQIYRNKKKEIEFKIHEQRKNKYEELIKILRDILVSVGGDEGEVPINRTQWLNTQLGMTIYGSKNVIKKINKMNEEARAQRSSTEILICFGELILEMRKEVGFDDRGLTIRDCLSLYITDIKDKKYDNIFKEYEDKKKKRRFRIF